MMTEHHSYIIPCGLLLLAVGALIRYHIGKRRFNRRGLAGLQQFSTYRKAAAVRFCESIINFLGSACIAAGVALVLIAYFN